MRDHQNHTAVTHSPFVPPTSAQERFAERAAERFGRSSVLPLPGGDRVVIALLDDVEMEFWFVAQSGYHRKPTSLEVGQAREFSRQLAIEPVPGTGGKRWV